MKKLAIALLASTALAAPALADGLVKRPVPLAEPADIVTVPTWTGFYVGPMAGIVLSQVDLGVGSETIFSLGQDDWAGGFLAGADVQFGAGPGARFHPVLGVWASGVWSNVKFGTLDNGKFADWQWAVGGRACLTMSTTTLACALAGYSEMTLKSDDMKLPFHGPIVGASLEVLITEKIAAGLRYTAFFPDDRNEDGFNVGTRRDEVMATLVFRFGGGKAPWN